MKENTKEKWRLWREKQRQSHWTYPLHKINKYVAAKIRARYRENTKQDLINDIVNKTTYGLGPKGEVICREWLGLKPKEKKKTSEQTIRNYIRTLERNGFVVMKKND